jgi:hypothetical protein
MGINFPDTPVLNQLHPIPLLPGLPQYRWDGEKWVTATSIDMPGTVRYDTAQTLTASQKAQARSNIDALKKNYIINGAMMVSQENGTTAGTAVGYYPVDMFSYSASAPTAVISTSQITSGTPAGSPNRLRLTVTTADVTVNAGDISSIQHAIEGFRYADLFVSGSKTITLQFGVKAPAGTYCVSFRNASTNRSYVAEYVIAAGEANTSVMKSVTLATDATGTWAFDNTAGVYINWTLQGGTTYQTAAGGWAAGNFMASPNQFNFLGTNGNIFELFDVGLYEGPAAPVFQVPDYPSELALCQRYLYAPLGGSAGYSGFVVSATIARIAVPFRTIMRAVPTLLTQVVGNVAINTATANGTGSAVVLNGAGGQGACGLDVTCAGATFTTGQGAVAVLPPPSVLFNARL